jgi:hypothetical protein
MSDAELLQMQMESNQTVDPSIVNNMSNYEYGMFNGADYLDTPFNVIVEVGEGAKYSELMLTSTLETLFLNGVISNLSPEDLMMYVELIPDYVFPKKNEFKLLVRQKQNSLNAQLQQQNMMLQEQLAQLQSQYQTDMGKAKAYAEALTNEYSGKINEYNEYLKKVGQAVQTPNTSSR